MDKPPNGAGPYDVLGGGLVAHPEQRRRTSPR